jgi:hypothetical protein
MLNQPDRTIPQYPIEALKVLGFDLAHPMVELQIPDRFQRNFLTRQQVSQLFFIYGSRSGCPAKQWP